MNSSTPVLDAMNPETPARDTDHRSGLLSGMCGAVLRRVRSAAWNWLDLETEFEPAD